MLSWPKSRDATHLATDGLAPRRYDGHTTAARVRVAVFVRSEKSNALVGGGVPRFRRAGQLRVLPPYESPNWGVNRYFLMRNNCEHNYSQFIPINYRPPSAVAASLAQSQIMKLGQFLMLFHTALFDLAVHESISLKRWRTL